VEQTQIFVHHLLDLARANHRWMTWNLLLAAIPAGLGLWLFARPHRRTASWWLGVVAFVLFLPNAPYVVTDLIHLRWNAAAAENDLVLVLGVLPLFALFVAAGFACYLVSLELIVREVQRVRPTAERWLIELVVHLVCSLGIVLGRVARLNSWDTVQDPRWTVERTFNALTWTGAPLAFVAIFVAVWLTATVLRVVALAGADGLRRALRRLTGGPDRALAPPAT
jgi:uncharacterized membrane protein